MSNVVEGRTKLEALATDLKAAGDKGTAQKIMNIVNNFLYRSHIGVAQGPKSVKRASKKKDTAPAKKSKPKAEKAAAPKKEFKRKSPTVAKAAKPKADKPAKAAKPKADKKANVAAAKTAMDAGADLGSNI